MAKRPCEDVQEKGRFAKRLRPLTVDRLSLLRDELLLRILSFVSVPTLITCQRLSHKFYAVAGDSQLWKALYYNHWVRPRASRLPRIRDPGMSAENLFYSSKVSKWLDEEALVKRGTETNWKRQFKLRHNWSRGSCGVSEVEVAKRPPIPPLLVRLHNGIIFTVDSRDGLRAWSTKEERKLLASVALADSDNTPGFPSPTSLSVDLHDSKPNIRRVAVGFQDGRFSVYELRADQSRFIQLYTHAPSSNGMVSAMAYASSYLITMTATQLLSLYKFDDEEPQGCLDPPRLLYSLKSHTVWPPLSLCIRPSLQRITVSIAYCLPTYLFGWSVGIQELHLGLDGQLVDSRLASALAQGFRTVSASSPSSPSGSILSEQALSPHSQAKQPTSLSYTHPYLLVSHPDNTLTLYLVTSTTSTLSISPGSRLWGHTSSISDAHVGGRGKAVSVSSRGDELRVWELEGGLASSASRRRLATGEMSVQVRPEQRVAEVQNLSPVAQAIAQRGSGLGLALEHRVDDLSVTRRWVGFDEENVVVLREKSQGSQALVVYDFT
ncbi:F-box domain-containing protein [Cryomyces antarcticus]